MSRDLTLKEQLEYADKVGKPRDPVFLNPEGQEVVVGVGDTSKQTLVKASARQTKKKRSTLKLRKVGKKRLRRTTGRKRLL